MVTLDFCDQMKQETPDFVDGGLSLFLSPKGSLDPHSQGFDPHSQGFGPQNEPLGSNQSDDQPPSYVGPPGLPNAVPGMTDLEIEFFFVVDPSVSW